jgi:hypothetical protein
MPEPNDFTENHQVLTTDIAGAFTKAESQSSKHEANIDEDDAEKDVVKRLSKKPIQSILTETPIPSVLPNVAQSAIMDDLKKVYHAWPGMKLSTKSIDPLGLYPNNCVETSKQCPYIVDTDEFLYCNFRWCSCSKERRKMPKSTPRSGFCQKCKRNALHSRCGEYIQNKRLCGWCTNSTSELSAHQKTQRRTKTVPEHFHLVSCYHCNRRFAVASHLSLPHTKQIMAAPPKADEKAKREARSKSTIRAHCSSHLGDHPMLWEVARREDFISNTDFCHNQDELGSTLLMVHTFLSSDFLVSLDRLPCDGLPALIYALGCWGANVKAKGELIPTL